MYLSKKDPIANDGQILEWKDNIKNPRTHLQLVQILSIDMQITLLRCSTDSTQTQ